MLFKSGQSIGQKLYQKCHCGAGHLFSRIKRQKTLKHLLSNSGSAKLYFKVEADQVQKWIKEFKKIGKGQ